MKAIIIDDDHLVVDALKTILIANDISVLATGYDGHDAINLYKQHSPDIVLLDIRMNNISGLGATKEILKYDPNAKILLITTFNDDEFISQAISLGCKGYILKDNISGIIPAIKAIESNNLVFDSKIISKLSKNTHKNEQALEIFSNSEKEIIKLIAEGYNNKEISEKLFLSEGTVRNYISNILEKLNIRDRTQLVVWYYKEK